MSGYISSVTLACYNIVSKSGLQTFPSKTKAKDKSKQTNTNHFFFAQKSEYYDRDKVHCNIKLVPRM